MNSFLAKNNEIVDEIKPIYYWTKPFGFSPYSIIISGSNPCLKKTRLNYLYSIVAMLIINVFIGTLIPQTFDSFDQTSFHFTQPHKIYHVAHVALITAFNIGIINCLFNANIFIEAFSTLVECDNVLKKYGAKVHSSTTKKFGICLILFEVAISIVNHLQLFLYYDILSAFSVYLISFINLIFQHLLLYWCLVITERFKSLNEYLLSFCKFEISDSRKLMIVFRNNTRKIFFKPEDLRNLSRIHSKLINSVRELNGIFSIHILICSAIYFIEITMQSFILISYYLGLTAKILTLSELLFHIYKLFNAVTQYTIFVWACSDLQFHANDVRKHLIRFKLEPKDFKMRREIINFLVQLVDDALQITAFGFFNIDLPFIQNSLGAVTTYVVILIQSYFA